MEKLKQYKRCIICFENDQNCPDEYCSHVIYCCSCSEVVTDVKAVRKHIGYPESFNHPTRKYCLYCIKEYMKVNCEMFYPNGNFIDMNPDGENRENIENLCLDEISDISTDVLELQPNTPRPTRFTRCVYYGWDKFKVPDSIYYMQFPYNLKMTPNKLNNDPKL